MRTKTRWWIAVPSEPDVGPFYRKGQALRWMNAEEVWSPLQGSPRWRVYPVTTVYPPLWKRLWQRLTRRSGKPTG